MSENDNERWIDKVQKLLRKAEGTDNKVEAEAFNAKAMMLMAKHSIDSAMLQASGQETPDSIEKIEIVFSGKHTNIQSTLLGKILAPFNVQAVTVNGWKIVDGDNKKTRTRKKVLFGYKQDLEKVKILYESLFMQLIGSMMGTPIPSWEHGKTFRASFAVGFINVIEERLTKIEREAKVESGPGTELVLVNRETLVIAERDKVFPKLRNLGGMRARASSGAALGRAEGQRANLGNGSSKALGY